MQLAAIILGAAALGGIIMAGIRLSGKPLPPTWLAVVHGLAAATGVGVLAYHAATTGLPDKANYALGVFVLAAVGGLVMFFGYHQRGRPLPVAFVLVHGLIAIAGYVLLLMGMGTI